LHEREISSLKYNENKTKYHNVGAIPKSNRSGVKLTTILPSR